MTVSEIQLLLESIFKFSVHEYAVKKKSLKIPFLGCIFSWPNSACFKRYAYLAYTIL